MIVHRLGFAMMLILCCKRLSSSVMRQNTLQMSTMQPPFHSSNRFMKVTAPIKDSNIFTIVGVPYDGATTNRPGARFGPRSIRDASHMLCDGTHPLFHISPIPFIQDIGDLSIPNTDIAAVRTCIEDNMDKLLKEDRHIICLGGDHSITLSILRAQYKKLGRPLSVVHFDAHCDTWQDHFDEPSGHGTWVYEAVKEGLVNPKCFTQIGIRSSGEKEVIEYVKDQGGLIITGRDLRGLETPDELRPIIQKILKQHSSPDSPVYMTLDIDCLDPSYAPGTGTPEIGGMTTTQVMSILEEIVPKLNFIGMDCVEVAPPYDQSDITSLAGAGFVWTYMCGLLSVTKPLKFLSKQQA